MRLENNDLYSYSPKYWKGMRMRCLDQRATFGSKTVSRLMDLVDELRAENRALKRQGATDANIHRTR